MESRGSQVRDEGPQGQVRQRKLKKIDVSKSTRPEHPIDTVPCAAWTLKPRNCICALLRTAILVLWPHRAGKCSDSCRSMLEKPLSKLLAYARAYARLEHFLERGRISCSKCIA